MAGLPDDEIVGRAQQMQASVDAALARIPSEPQPVVLGAARAVDAPADPAQLQHWLFERGWSDGLPVIAPTREAVQRMVEGAGRPAGELVGIIPPRGGAATVEQIAINAVMAGCSPQHMPVLVAAVQALLEPCFSLASVQATTHPVAPLLIVHGPIAQALGMNAGAGTFGPGAIANAVLGRALRLVLWTVGGALPGTADRATQGSPSKYSFCIAENIAESPWEPFVQTRGLAPDANAVTVYGGEAPHNINDHEHGDAQGILTIAADVLRTLGSNNWYLSWHGRKELLLVLCPEHAADIARSGWSRRQVQQFMFDRISRRHDELALGGMYTIKDWPQAHRDSPPGTLLPAVEKPEDILVLVAGGAGRHSAGLPSFGATVSVTREIRLP